MKLKQLVLLILVMTSIININSKSYAKYVFEYVEIAAEIQVEN